jgi:TP901 family phage tail tape measure protein
VALNGNGGIGLGITLQVDDLASGVLDKATEAVARLEKGLDRLDRQSQKTATSVASVGKAIFNAGRGFLEGAWKLASGAGGELEAATHEIEHFGKATSEQMLDVNEAIFSSQNALMGFTALDSAKALKALAIETGDAQKALDQLSPALLYAGITGKSGEAGVKAMTAAMRMFPQEGKDAGEVVDRLAVSSELFHLKASEMSDALGRAGPAAQAVGASMTDTAITIGLMRTGMGNLSKTSMAAMAALRGMANPKFGSTLKGIGIDAKDAAGNAKSLPTIMGELADKVGKTGTITDKTRDAMRKAFGPQALPGLTAAIKDLAKGVTDSNGVLHKGADAVQYYYDKMHDNEGAARALLDAQLDTFKGQEKVLNSVITSLKQGLSAPLASALKPAVRELALAGAKILEYFSKMDPETKTFIAQATLLAGVLVTVLGAAFIFLGGPAALAVGALIAIGAALFAAYHQNLGGFADFVDTSVKRVMLVFRALASLFTHDGGLSKGLFDELSNDPGLLNFVLNVYVAFNKVKAFVMGFVDGFQAGLARVQPVFDALADSFKRVAQAFGFMSDEVDVDKNAASLKSAGEAGKWFGDMLANAASVIARVFTAALDILSGFLTRLDDMSEAASPLSEAFETVKLALTELMAAFGESGDSFELFGGLLGDVITIAIAVVSNGIATIAGVFRGVVNIWAGVIKALTAISNGDWTGLWQGMKQVVYGVVTQILSILGGLTGAIQGILGAIGIKMPDVKGMIKNIDAELKTAMLGVPIADVRNQAATGGAASVVTPLESEFFAPAKAPAAADMPAVAGAPSAFGPAASPGVPSVTSKLNITSQLHLDGKVLYEELKQYDVASKDDSGVH